MSLGKYNGLILIAYDRPDLHIYIGPLSISFFGFRRPVIHWGGNWKEA